MIRDSKGQILLPGLAVFFILMTGFIGLVLWGRDCLTQMRMTMAAEATALSVARVEAAMLNNRAMFNTGLNIYFTRYKNVAAMVIEKLPIYEDWHALQIHLLRTAMAGSQGQYVALGNVVARANGAEFCKPLPARLDLQITLRGLGCVLMNGPEPAGWTEFEDVYLMRTWRPNLRNAQPTHQTTWIVGKGSIDAGATARVYLDVQNNASLHNGGFPYLNEKGWEATQFLPFFPQFNAKLIQGKTL